MMERRKIFFSILTACGVVVSFSAVQQAAFAQTESLPVIEIDSTEVKQARRAGKTVQLPTIAVHLIELHHYQCERSFDQLLFWAKYPNGQMHIREWKLARNSTMIRQKKGDLWIATWEYEGVAYSVTAPKFRELTTMSDFELIDRQSLPKDQRLNIWIWKE